MFMYAFKSAFGVIKKKPFMLWGLSLLSGIVTAIATILTTGLPFLGIAFGYVITVGMSRVYLDGLDGKKVNSDQLFSGFGKGVFRIAGGMAWQKIWSVIWTLAGMGIALLVFLVLTLIGGVFGDMGAAIFGVIGLIFAIISAIPISIYVISKNYSYSFVPYILSTRPDVTATQALRLSMELTRGKKLQMWLADFFYAIITGLISLILGLFCMIPFIGSLFMIVTIFYFIILFVFGPLFRGLYKAEFYRLKIDPPAKPRYDTFNHIENLIMKEEQ
ncbi:MAG: hypothetical protein IKI97_09510 [Clostridia bacterium]|nr:hypothetical protein [Clostridia bacterium]